MEGMSPSSSDRRTTSGEYVSYPQFMDFAKEVRDQYGKLNESLLTIHRHPQLLDFAEGVRDQYGKLLESLTNIQVQLTEGSAKFREAEAGIAECARRADDHSGKLKVLEEERVRREERDEVTAANNAPRKALLEEVRRTVITATVLGGLAIVYNAWREYEIGRQPSSPNPPAAAAPAP